VAVNHFDQQEVVNWHSSVWSSSSMQRTKKVESVKWVNFNYFKAFRDATFQTGSASFIQLQAERVMDVV